MHDGEDGGHHTISCTLAERERILERINEGRLEARAKGVKFGRNPE